MKSKILTLFVILLLSAVTVHGQNNSKKINPVGTWKFEAPYAPEGYTSGVITVARVNQQHTTTMSFTGSDYKLSGEKVKAGSDSVTFTVYLEGQDIKVLLKMENEAKMSGKAIYSEGEVPLTLTKTVETVLK